MIEEISFCDKSHRNKIVNDQRDSLKLKKKTEMIGRENILCLELERGKLITDQFKL